ncbi:hypothetical protein [Shewanella surugensis]|uniref:Virulence factor Evf domain-containing protein n=1 Tax=Shewanella surugensis TaxID=212020 RepID=A0ABT0LFK2_9GAMM|nr:hypothetical protein [Shewanella surugensis]MCL1126491.1 hypothetical protein [Shewanella surugensis]
MGNLEKETSLWLSNIGSLSSPVSFTNSIFHNPLIKLDASTTQNPANAFPTATYKEAADMASTPGTAPISVFDGLQTSVNMCRTKAEFDPLDPNGNGDLKHFLGFTNLVSQVPFLTLEWSESKEIKQKSHNANELIDSFVDGFRGILSSDKESIIQSVQNLVKAALSYSEQTEKQSNFSQNILKDGDGKVNFFLYTSTFEISQSSSKGMITFHAEYTLNQAGYSLETSTWERIKEQFANLEKTTVDDWLNNMTTEPREGSTVRALCLEDPKPKSSHINS